MKVRLRDFAEIHRISERTVQVHIKNNQEELEGHIDRRGKQGTWLDEFAVNFLLDRIQLPTKDEVLTPTPREGALLVEIAEANKKLAEAERVARENAEAAGKVKFLEAAKEAQEAQISDLSKEVGKLTQKAAEAEKTAQKARQELVDAHTAFEEDLTKKNNRIQELEAYAAAQKARADFFALPWIKRIGKKAPVVPELQED